LFEDGNPERGRLSMLLHQSAGWIGNQMNWMGRVFRSAAGAAIALMFNPCGILLLLGAAYSAVMREPLVICAVALYCGLLINGCLKRVKSQAVEDDGLF